MDFIFSFDFLSSYVVGLTRDNAEYGTSRTQSKGSGVVGIRRQGKNLWTWLQFSLNLRPGRNLISRNSHEVKIKLRLFLSFQPYFSEIVTFSYLEMMSSQNQKEIKEAVDLAAVFSELILV